MKKLLLFFLCFVSCFSYALAEHDEVSDPLPSLEFFPSITEAANPTLVCKSNISLQFTYPPISIGHTLLLPNNSLLVEYYTPNTIEFYKESNDILDLVIEIFDADGKSIRAYDGYTLQTGSDEWFTQYVLLPDRFIFEFYSDLSLDTHLDVIYDFEGVYLDRADVIAQPDANKRYATNLYPYLVETFPFGDDGVSHIKLTNYLSGSTQSYTSSLPVTFGTSDDSHLFMASKTPEGEFLLRHFSSSCLVSDEVLLPVQYNSFPYISTYEDTAYCFFENNCLENNQYVLHSYNFENHTLYPSITFSLPKHMLINDVFTSPWGHIANINDNQANTNSLCLLKEDGSIVPLVNLEHPAYFLKSNKNGNLMLLVHDTPSDDYRLVKYQLNEPQY